MVVGRERLLELSEERKAGRNTARILSDGPGPCARGKVGGQLRPASDKEKLDGA